MRSLRPERTIPLHFGASARDGLPIEYGGQTTLIIKTCWKDGHETIDTIVYTAEEMAGIFHPHERNALHRGDIIERGGVTTIRYVDATAVALKAGL